MPVEIDKNLYRFISSSLEEGSTKEARQYYDDPTTVGFNMIFHFDSDENSPLFNESDCGESAIRYLKAINEPDRAKRLKSFKENLRTIVQRYPYYFTDLDGLDGIYDLDPNNGFDFERKLTITSLESIDFRIAKLIEEYMLASYDMEYRRQMLPSNMTEFRLEIIVSEIRQFRTFVGSTIGNKEDQFPLNMKYINDNLTMFVYKFDRCTFDFSESNPFLSKISNTQPEVASNAFSIKVGKLTTAHQISFLDLAVDMSLEDTPISSVNKKVDTGLIKKAKELGSYAKDTAKDILAPKMEAFLQENDPRYALKRILKDEVLDRLDSKLKGLLNGNIYAGQFENPFGNPSEEVAKLVLNHDKVKGLNNIYGFVTSPTSSILESVIKSNLGNILD